MYNKKYISNNLVYPLYWLDLIPFKSGINLNKVFIIFGTFCQNNCFFCDNKEYLFTLNCFGCYKNTSNKLISNEDILNFLYKVQCADYRSIDLIGGDLFDDPLFLEKILLYINKNANINIFWSGNKISKRCMKLIKNFNVTLFVQIIDTQLQDVKIMELLHTFKDVNISVNLIVVSKDKNIINNYKQLRSYFQDNIKNLYINIVFPVAEASNFKEYFMETLPRTNISDYLHKKVHHPCLYGSICLQMNGNVTACPRMIYSAIGTIKDLNAVFCESNYKKFWNLNKDKIENCKECKFRYVCNDCRFIQSELTNHLCKTIPCKYMNHIKEGEPICKI